MKNMKISNKHKYIAIIFSEIILLTPLFYCPPRFYYLMLGLYQIQICIVMFAYYITDNKFIGAIFVRRSLYFVPYIISMFLFGNNLELHSKTPTEVFFVCVIAVAGGFLLYAPQLKKISIYFNKEFNILLGRRAAKEIFLDVYSSIMSSVFQEIFYKCCVLFCFSVVSNNFIAIIVSAALFMIEHFLHFNSKKQFDFNDYILQFIMSSFGGGLYLWSGSIFPPIILHMTYNLPRTLSYFVRNYHNFTYK